MNMKLGAHITALRKEKGKTQEQLAMEIGVSAPAVSKWETDASCPDIALLCPLARALGTNVDTLLRFEEDLSEKQLTDSVAEIVEEARADGWEKAETMLLELLHTYPSNSQLKFNAVMVLDTFTMIFPRETKQKEKWKKLKHTLLLEIYENGPSAYWQNAVSILASVEIQDGNLGEAERLLKELPEHTTDTTMFWTQIHLKRGERQKAIETVQKRLYTLAGQLQTCLMLMMNDTMEPEAERMLELCKVYQEFEGLFGVGGGLGSAFFVEVYMRMGQQEKALDSLNQMIDAVTKPLKPMNPLLFSSLLTSNKEGQTVTKELKEILLQGLMEEELYQPLRERGEFQKAVEKLRKNIDEA